MSGNKFKIGDRVRALQETINITEGNVYTVTGIYSDPPFEPRIMFINDAGEPDGWIEDFF